MYLENSFPLPWRWRAPLERLAMALPLREPPFGGLTGLPGPAPLTIAAAGDLSMERMPSYDAGDVLQDMRGFWDSADIRVANLESQCTDRAEPAIAAKGMRAPGEAARFLAAARLDAVTVANNHALDFGSGALEESCRRAADLGVGVAGFVEAAQQAARPFVGERNGLRVGMLAWCDHHRFPGKEPVTARPATLPEEADLLGAVRELRARTDIVVVQLHWGYEFVLHPLLRHRDLARRIAEAGAHAVLCHHAHVPMALELWGGSLIAHGLGNWIFADRAYFRNSHDWTFRSFLLKFGVSPQGVHAVTVEPFVLGKDSRIRKMEGSARERFLAQLTRMNRRLGDHEFLRRAQDCRMIYEALRTVEQLRDASWERLQEKARTLGLPAGTALAQKLREMPFTCAQSLGRWFSSLAESAEDWPHLERIWRDGRDAARRDAVALGNQHRWLDAFRARIP